MPNSVLTRGRKFVARLTALAMVASIMVIGAAPASAAIDTSATCPSSTPSAGFTDIAAYSADTQLAINCLVDYGISVGTSATTYSPAQEVSRWQMALFLTRQAEVHGLTLGDGSSQGFTDISAYPAATQTAINQLAQLDITQGTTATTYSPADPVSRWQMALFLTRLLTKAGVTLGDGSSQGFTDISAYPASTQTAINQLAQEDVADGFTATTFGPASSTLRSQMALFLTRTLAADGIVPAPGSNQTYSVTPTDSVVLAFNATRTYTATVASGTVVDISLFPSESVNIDENGVVTFVDAGSNDVADGGAVTPTITSVNGVPGATTDGITSGGTITFTITSAGADSVVPVVWSDSANDDDIDLVVPTSANANPKEPTDDIGIGGETVFVAAEAAIGGSTPTVTGVDTTADYFTSATATYFWDANDTFQYQGVGISQAQFESMISVGDALSVSYNPDAAGVSVFNITADAAPVAPNVSAAAASNLDGGTTANDVRVTFTPDATNSDGVTYTLQRGAAGVGVGGVCGGGDDVAAGTWATVGGAPVANANGTMTFTDSNVANGCYDYRIVATNPVSGTSANGASWVTTGGLNGVTVPAPADATAPTSTSLSQTNGAGFGGTLDSGDTITVVFSEAMGAVAVGDTIRFTDGDGTIVDVVNGTNATFTLNGPATTLTVVLTANPTVVAAGTTVGLQVASGVASDHIGLADSAGNGWNIGGSADVALA